jgi:lipopolysaccharide transport system permease protein
MSDRSLTGGSDPAPGAGHAALPVTVIRASRGWDLPDFGELLSNPDLLLFLVVRNIKVRYRQTLLGAGWAIVQPLATMVMLTFVFGRLIGVPSEGVPYWIFSLSGLVLWIFFSQTVNGVSSSLVMNSQLIEKAYFSRIALPTAATLAGLVDFSIGFTMLVLVLALAGPGLSWTLLLCPLLGLLAALVVLGIGGALAALTVRFRDVTYVIPFAMQLWLFATPVVYPLSIVPEKWRLVLALNPATGLVETFRWAALGTDTNPWPYLAVSCASGAVLLLGGLLLFRRMERSFADVI